MAQERSAPRSSLNEPLQSIATDDFAIVPFGFAIEQRQPPLIAGMLLRALRVCQIRLPALEYRRDIVVVRVSIHAIGVACDKPGYLPSVKGRRLRLDELSELGFHARFDAKMPIVPLIDGRLPSFFSLRQQRKARPK